MKHWFLLLGIVITLSGCFFAKSRIVYDYDEGLPKLLAGTKYAYIINPGISKYDPAMMKAFKRHFKQYNGILPYKQGVTDDPCEILRLEFQYTYGVAKITDFSLTYTGCDNVPHQLYVGDMRVQLSKNVHGEQKIALEKLREKTLDYPTTYEHQRFPWTEESIKVYLDTATNLQAYEGIYEHTSGRSRDTKYRLALIKHQDNPQLIYLGGAEHKRPWLWFEGDVKAELLETEDPNKFNAKYFMLDKSVASFAKMEYWDGTMTVNINNLSPSTYQRIFSTSMSTSSH